MTFPLSSTTAMIARGHARVPRVAMVVKAETISSGTTSNVPSAIEGTGCRGLSMPQRRAIRTMSLRPIVSAARMVGTLRDSASAWRALTGPLYSWSKFCGAQGWPETSISRGESSRTVAAVNRGARWSCAFWKPAR